MGHYQVQDHYFNKAKQFGFRARSVFKLQEIQQKFRLLKKGDQVLDLGAAPGSFLQFMAKIVGPEGRLIGLDLQGITPLPFPYVQTNVVDITDEAALKNCLKEQRFTVITSDLAPKTSGIKDLDQARSVELNEQALEIAKLYLKSGGNLLLKIFVGADFQKFWFYFKKLFIKAMIFKSSASRSGSSEVYLIGLGFKK